MEEFQNTFLICEFDHFAAEYHLVCIDQMDSKFPDPLAPKTAFGTDAVTLLKVFSKLLILMKPADMPLQVVYSMGQEIAIRTLPVLLLRLCKELDDFLLIRPIIRIGSW